MASFDFASLTLRYAQDERLVVGPLAGSLSPSVRPERSEAQPSEVEGRHFP